MRKRQRKKMAKRANAIIRRLVVWLDNPSSMPDNKAQALISLCARIERRLYPPPSVSRAEREAFRAEQEGRNG